MGRFGILMGVHHLNANILKQMLGNITWMTRDLSDGRVAQMPYYCSLSFGHIVRSLWTINQIVGGISPITNNSPIVMRKSGGATII